MNNFNPFQNAPLSPLHNTRRHFIQNCPLGLAAVYLSSQLGGSALAKNLLPQGKPRHGGQVNVGPTNPTAKQVIFIHLAGAPPTLDMFDPKPALNQWDGKDCPDEYLAGKKFAFTAGTPKLLGSPRTFKQYGESGMWMSDALQHLPSIADELCMVRSMYTDQFNHAPAELMMLTGSPRQGRPSMGSWVTYGLGTENEDLPGFIVLNSGGTQPSAGKSAWGSGFLPSVFQGVQCRSTGDPVLYVSNPDGMPSDVRRKTIDAINRLNHLQMEELGGAETATRIAQYELAYRMQTSVPEAMDITRETQETIEAYGAKPGEASFANNCLLARRLVEQGVRFVQLFDWGWDFHGTDPTTGLTDGLTNKCALMDRPVTALIKDLKERGLLDDTLVIWSGEFGRTPFREGRTAASNILGRDHYPDCYSMFMAGGGVKSGLVYGATDELGFSVAENPMHVHDFQATVLHLLGFDHTQLTYRFQGRDFRLTDVHGEIVPALLA